ncbi:MAG: aldo/keto reductase [Bacteroidales bacterium]|nr:aldo/keto reductase [Candidatus Cacconaster caballi]
MKKTIEPISRRNFLKVMGSGAAATAAIAACGPKNIEKIASGKEVGEMTYRTDREGGKVSLLGYGCMRWPQVEGPDGKKVIDQEAVNGLVDYAIAHGITYFDTAPLYLQAQSETATGIALSRYPRESYTIATKMSNYRIPKTLEAGVQMYRDSLKKLQTDYIDYYLLHSIGGGDDPLGDLNKRFFDNGLLDFLVKERREGRIRNLGWSFHGDIKVFDHMLALHDEGKYHWDFVQIQMNYVDWGYANTRDSGEQNASYMYEELAKRDIPVVIMEPLLGGQLASLNDHANEELLSHNPGESIASWAFRFCASFPKVLTVLSGMTYMEHLQDNLRTFSPAVPLNEEEMQMLDRIAKEYVQFPLVPCTGCSYCMPCPYGVDIPGVFAQYNKCVNEGLISAEEGDPEYRKARRAFLVSLDRKIEPERRADHCIGCRKCTQVCPQRIAIPGHMRKIDAYIESLKRTI